VSGDEATAALVARLADALIARGATIAAAESCTGGLVAAACTARPGSSAWFERGGVTYSNAAKTELLGVAAATIEAHGAVSAETAAAMASGVRSHLGVDVGIAVTGIAGPDGGTPEKPVGLVHVHVSTPDEERGTTFDYPGDRESIRRRSTVAALHLARRVLAQSSNSAA